MVVGHFVDNNLAVSQHKNIILAFKEMFERHDFDTVIEIGTAHGGLTTILDELNKIKHERTGKKFYLRSFDIFTKDYFSEIVSTGFNFSIENLNFFTYSYQELNKENLSYLQKIMSEGKTLVLCDGGSKKNEFKLLAPLLKSGDIIMAHDYIDTLENFESKYKNKIWNWREIGIEDVQPVCKENNLVPYMSEIFTSVVWFCAIKK